MPLEQRPGDDQAALLARFVAGDRHAAEALTDLIAPRILRFAARMLGDLAEAEDVTQEAMLRLWRMAPDWQSGAAQPATWVYRVAANLCTDRLRRRRKMLHEVPELPDTSPSQHAQMMQTARIQALEAALSQLPERQRQAVILRHLEGMSNPEIAAIMMLGVEAVESLTARGKRNLSAILAGDREALGYDDDD
ncbi:RNA polymerase sigma factor [Roseinatronobacter bogoriensis]|uniref:RNA polymerase subunit sigma n=1 Tax=Roseinatronobacter bogoriensis subsp. barguzinensis TaxID=441209 RepID=A0A2K8KED1_9RHOB|nr:MULTISPECIES: RNA polymerase sigma factor [Rhodobaca]ATX67356.1 RNA polymerase subunit sigma [Rhodobaca barguzinensis]MBB4206927.1 RNA polymerase sigma-70 factor (ECF subfamily) [Rhodobaca bogoriensis DSM 18756]TDW41670.1 RNA polymerase ECF family sigma subunit [Rhodobaca barguzinensis]TDY74151.1 RNA polymerase ECF family sigma subunit [Rhodobaca bogoriensis DSM 18756]